MATTAAEDEEKTTETTTTTMNDVNEEPSTKRQKTTKTTDKTNQLLLSKLVSSEILNNESNLRKQYSKAEPYPHCLLPNLFEPNFLRSVQLEIKNNSKVNFKESDLFKMYQSIDLANLSDDNNDKHSKDMPSVMKLRKILYSKQWRNFIERVAGIPTGTLTDQVDCACNCHSTSCHLLCHDDVIKTRLISYIIYLTDDEPTVWQSSEGGALELYDSTLDATTNQRVPDSIPCKTTLPIFNSMAFFKVDPGFSFHAVQEVVGDRPRLSLQGWYHCSKEPDNIQDATLQRLKAVTKKKKGSASEENDGYQMYPDSKSDATDEKKEEENGGEEQAVAKAATSVRAKSKDNKDNELLLSLSESDRNYLSQYIDETYLKPEALKEMKECFEEESSIQLRHFLQDKWMDQIEMATSKEGEGSIEERLPIDDPEFFKQGITDSWKLVGPSHMQRFLQYDNNNNSDKKEEPESAAGELLRDIVREKVLQSQPFRRFLQIITSLGEPTGYKGRIRRFVPGRDYTVAHYGLLSDKSVLDATFCTCAGTGILHKDDEENEEQEDGTEQKKPAEGGSKGGRPDEADMAWQSGDVGGFECYIAAEDGGDDNKKDVPDESYNMDNGDNGDGDEDGNENELLSVSASNNTLSLVYRDPGTMRFVRYLSHMAPSSRWDVAMEYQVNDDDDEGDNDDDNDKEGQDDTAIGF